jgi:hypothetical protein
MAHVRLSGKALLVTQLASSDFVRTKGALQNYIRDDGTILMLVAKDVFNLATR